MIAALSPTTSRATGSVRSSKISATMWIFVSAATLRIASNATTAIAYNIDKAFQPRTRVTVQVNFHGSSGTRYVARGTPYKPRDRDASLRFKRARYSSYKMMRAR